MLSRFSIHRIACAIVAAEVGRLRGTVPPALQAGDWPEETAIGDAGLGLDSLERLGAVAALAETFQIDDSAIGATPPTRVADWLDWIARGRTDDSGITVMTSGSTGTPRACRHAVRDLIDEARHIAGLFPDRRRIVALVPAHHLYGMIWTALLPAMLGIDVVVQRVGAALNLLPGDLIVAVPDQWRAMLRLQRFGPGLYGVSSAAMLPDALGNDLLAAGLARLFDVYGSSETSAIALRELPETDYTILPRWRLVAAGDDWRLVDRQGVPSLLPDHVIRTGPRTLRPTGRRDGAVQVGGYNVWPERVAAMLRQGRGVADVAVRPGANGRLKAFVVPVAGADPDAVVETLERIAMDRLSEAERPKAYRFGDALPRNAMGKLADWD